jgi:hypothetical protein
MLLTQCTAAIQRVHDRSLQLIQRAAINRRNACIFMLVIAISYDACSFTCWIQLAQGVSI